MTRVRMIATISGTRNGVSWPPTGGYVELPDGEAEELIRNEQAIAAPRETKVERATKPADDVESRDVKAEAQPAEGKAVSPDAPPKTTARRPNK